MSKSRKMSGTLNFLPGRVDHISQRAGFVPDAGGERSGVSMTAFAHKSAARLPVANGGSFAVVPLAALALLGCALALLPHTHARAQAAPASSVALKPTVPPPPLPVDTAFPMTATLDKKAGGAIVLKIDVQPGHYVYRDRFEFQRDGEAIYSIEKFKQAATVKPTQKRDPQFGEVLVYESPVNLKVGQTQSGAAKLVVMYQGCSELAGVCYPPTRRTFDIKEAGVAVAANEVAKPGLGAQFKKQVSQ